jgi:hypothetical protein
MNRGTPSRVEVVAPLRVLRTCVTKQTKDMRMVRRMGPRYRDVEPLWFLSFGLMHG